MNIPMHARIENTILYTAILNAFIVKEHTLYYEFYINNDLS